MARKEAGRAELTLTQIRLSTLQGFHERLVHLTLGQTRRLLGGTVAPAGACSSHRNPRREREGDVRCPFHLKRLGVVTRPLAESWDSYACAGGEGGEGEAETGKECLLLGEGAMASFQLSHPSLQHMGIPVSLPHNSSLICDCIPRSLPRAGYRSLLHRLEDREIPQTQLWTYRQQIQKRTQAPALVSQSPERCVSGEQKRGSI